MKQAFIFDVFGTLVDWRTGVATVVQKAFEERSLTTDPLAFADAWRGQYIPSMRSIRTGARAYTPLNILHRENLDTVLLNFDIADEFNDAARADLNHAWERLPPWPDVNEGMNNLRPFGFLAPCSNGSVALSVRLARFAGLSWDTIVGAETARDYKPSAEVYRASARALGLAPEQVVMVAAHNNDLEAAQSAGLQTAFFPRPTEHGTAQTFDLAPSQDWTYVAENLIDLAAQVEARNETPTDFSKRPI